MHHLCWWSHNQNVKIFGYVYQNTNGLFVNWKTVLFLSVYVDDTKNGRTETKSFFDHVYLGCTQREWKTSKDIVDNYRAMFESRMSAGGEEQLHYSEKIWSKHFLMVLRHGRSCEEMRRKILRTGEQVNSTITQSRKSVNWGPSIQRRRNWISWRIVHSLLTNCLGVLVFGKNC